MPSLTDHVLVHFHERWESIKADPMELERRIARRRTATVMRPPRAWCAAIRASDLRINPYRVSCDCRHAYDEHRAHRVMLYAEELEPLVAPVYILWPGEPWDKVAAKLGVQPTCLRHARKNKRFIERKVPGLEGRMGKPIPVLYCDGPLDPSAKEFVPPDESWGTLWKHRGVGLPRELDQTVDRVPEHRMLYGKQVFRGWMWICPGCGKRCKKLLMPLRRATVEEYLNLGITDNDLSAAPVRVETFACEVCHNVRNFTRSGYRGWNEFVSYLTGGLLYGKEVPIPDWWPRRLHAYAKRRVKVPAERAEVERLLADTDMSEKEISMRLRLPIDRVRAHRRAIFENWDVMTRDAFREAHRESTSRATHEPLRLSDVG